MPKVPQAIVYVDAFNLYYGALQGTAFKWLDLESLFDKLLPEYKVNKIYYFTAHLQAKANPRDPTAPIRQKTYLKALSTLSRVEVVYGNFTVQSAVAPRRRKSRFLGFKMPRTWSYGSGVRIWKIEEKGSDVSLGSRMTLDAARNEADLYVMVTSDSDLAPTVDMIRSETQASVAHIPPHRSLSKRLNSCDFEFTVRISRGTLQSSQLPEKIVLPRTGASITKPEQWNK
jgi:uncharacterized LabA/DUF88 family protein